jgi:MFS family permease
LKTANFRLYFAGMLGQWIALSGQQVAQTFLVYYLTGSPAILGTTALAQGLPQLILLLFGGAFADRFQKKRLLQFGQLGGGLTALIILVGLMTGYLSKDNPGCWWLLILTSVISGICYGMALPARQAMITEIVSPEKLMNAVGLSTMGQNVCTLVGPTMAGFLIAGFGFKWVYLAMAVLYFVAVALTNFLPATRTIIRKGSNTFRDVIEGLRYVGRNKTILAVVVFNLLCIFLSMPRLQLMPIFAIDILHVGAGGQGILQSVGAIGSLIAAGAYASLPPRNRGKMMILAGLALGLALTVFAFSHSYALSIAMMVLMGMGQVGHSNMGTVLVQSLAEKEYLGRSMSILLMGQASANLGTFFVGVIAEFAGAPWTLGVLGMILFSAAASSLIFLTRLRKLD